MVYGVEAVLPVEIGVEISQVQAYTLIGNEAIQTKELDLVEKKWDNVKYRMKQYRSRVCRAYNKSVFPCYFQVGDLVLRKMQLEDAKGKLEPK